MELSFSIFIQLIICNGHHCHFWNRTADIFFNVHWNLVNFLKMIRIIYSTHLFCMLFFQLFLIFHWVKEMFFEIYRFHADFWNKFPQCFWWLPSSQHLPYHIELKRQITLIIYRLSNSIKYSKMRSIYHDKTALQSTQL